MISPPAWPAPPSRALAGLTLAATLGGLGQSVAGSVGALLADRVTGSTAAAGLPQVAIVLGSGVASLVLGRLGGIVGRGRALALGAVAAVAGAVVTMLGAGTGDIVVVLLGTGLLGAGNAATLLIRYAAAADPGHRTGPQAMAVTLTATTVGAVAGPNLLGPADQLGVHVGLAVYAGPVAVGGIAFALMGLVLSTLRGGEAVRLDLARPAPWGRTNLAGLSVLALSNLVMLAVMTVTPLRISHHGGHLVVVGVVISLHVVGMFAPSPVSGLLVTRWGAAPTAALGGLVLTASCLTATAASTVVLTVAMLGLGLGWNICLVSGSTLLTHGLSAAQGPRREGQGEAASALAAAVGALTCGPLLALYGYEVLAVAGSGVGVLVLAVALRVVRAGVNSVALRDARPTTAQAPTARGARR